MRPEKRAGLHEPRPSSQPRPRPHFVFFVSHERRVGAVAGARRTHLSTPSASLLYALGRWRRREGVGLWVPLSRSPSLFRPLSSRADLLSLFSYFGGCSLGGWMDESCFSFSREKIPCVPVCAHLRSRRMAASTALPLKDTLSSSPWPSLRLRLCLHFFPSSFTALKRRAPPRPAARRPRQPPPPGPQTGPLEGRRRRGPHPPRPPPRRRSGAGSARAS